MDYRTSEVGRRRSWYGAKKHVKRLFGLRLTHAALRAVRPYVPALRDSGRLPAPSHLKEVEGRVHGASFTMLRPDRCIIAKELYWGRGRRPRAEDDMAVEVFARLARDADVVLDIGAYTGLFSLVAAAVNEDLHVHAFEIVPDVYKALFDNCVRNDVLRRATLHHVGIGPPDSTVRMPVQSVGSALPDFYSTGLTFEDGVDVPLRALDSLGPLWPPDARMLVKIDVEGTEDEVFRHGQEVLRTARPDILCEVLAGQADGKELEGLLDGIGYRYYLVEDRSLRRLAHIEPDPRYRDWLFTRRDEADLRARGIPVEE